MISSGSFKMTSKISSAIPAKNFFRKFFHFLKNSYKNCVVNFCKKNPYKILILVGILLRNPLEISLTVMELFQGGKTVEYFHGLFLEFFKKNSYNFSKDSSRDFFESFLNNF